VGLAHEHCYIYVPKNVPGKSNEAAAMDR
jgi:hypothetical protein